MTQPDNIQKKIWPIIARRLLELLTLGILIFAVVITYDLVEKKLTELHMNLNNPTVNSQRAALDRDLIANKAILSTTDKLAPMPDDIAGFVTQLQLLGTKHNSTVNVAEIQEEKINTNQGASPTPTTSPEFKLIPVILHITAVGPPTDLLNLLHDFEYMPYLVEAPAWQLQIIQPGNLGQSQGPENIATPTCASGSLSVQLRLFTQQQTKKL